MKQVPVSALVSAIVLIEGFPFINIDEDDDDDYDKHLADS